MSTTTLTVRVDPEVAERLDKLARATRRSKSFLAAEAIEEYLVLQEWQIAAIQQGLDAVDRGDGVDLATVKRRWESKVANSPNSAGR